MLFGRKRKNAAWEDVLENAVKKLEAGDFLALHTVYCAFATENLGLIRRAGNAIGHQMASMPQAKQLRLCGQFGTYTSMEWTIDWKKVPLERMQRALPKETLRYVLLLGSFHPNGYFREKCIRAMAEYEGMLYWLFPRVNDWVLQIRETAFSVLEKYLKNCDVTELIDSLPAFERLWDCRRRTEGQMQALQKQMDERLCIAIRKMDFGNIPGMEPGVRKALYITAVREGLFTLCQMEACMNQEKMSCLKRILIRGILMHPDCTLGFAERYLKNPAAQVRRMAVEFKYERLKTCWDGLEEMLLDSSKGVRGYALYIMERHSDVDIRAYYLAHLKDDMPAYAILGLSEFCRHGNVQELLECLEKPGRKVLKCTLLALGSQEDLSDKELLWNYLWDDRNDIAKAAYLSVRKKEFYFGAGRLYKAYLEAKTNDQRKKYFLKLLLAENSWSRLPYLLRLYRNDMPKQEKYLVMSGIHRRFMYAKLTEETKKDILLALEENRERLPKELEKEIMYDMKFM